MGNVVEDLNLFTRLERREAQVGAARAPKSIAEAAAAAGADLALDGEIRLHVVEVAGRELKGLEVLVRLVTLRLVFGVESFRETAGAVLTGTLATNLGLAFGCCEDKSVSGVERLPSV